MARQWRGRIDEATQLRDEIKQLKKLSIKRYATIKQLRATARSKK
jgi:hypothetical protein